jgi:cobalt-zinc-cadmium resistance protein CzcA
VSYGLSFRDVFDALAANNANAGGGYVENNGEQYLIRSTGLVQGVPDIANILVGSEHGVPIRIGALADVGIGRDLRTGAATDQGQEVVIGTTIMLAGENSRLVASRVDDRLKTISTALPPGVEIKTLYNRTYLVDATLSTVKKNLLEGAILVIVVLFLMLGNIRAALIAALAIPLSMLIAVTGMVEGKISGNLMSLGAIDFGLIVDGSVIIVENCIRRFAEEQHRLGRLLTREERLAVAFEASQSVRKATIFGEMIIAVVYLPILTLQGVEGKMFTPMAQTVILALAGATILSMTFIPAMIAIFLTGRVKEEDNFAVRFAKRLYDRILGYALRHRWTVVFAALAILAGSALVATRLGSEFAPKLSEGAIAIGVARLPSTSLTTSVEMQTALEKKLKASFPDELAEIFARTGTAEVATDPMGPNMSDTYLMLTPRAQWKRATTQDELAVAIDKVLGDMPGQLFEISQPIELRFNELISGVRSDVAVKIFGDDLDTLRAQANRVATILQSINGAADVKVEQTTGLPVLTMEVLRDSAARYGLNVADVQLVVETAIGGRVATKVLEADRRFNMVMRLRDAVRRDVSALENLPVQLPRTVVDEAKGVDEDTHVKTADTALSTSFVPLGAVAKISLQEGPNQISHENGKRRIVIQANVRGRDLGGFVAEAEKRIADSVKLPTGYWVTWGGQFENLVAARERLTIVVPVALFLIFGLLYLSFGSVKNALLIFSGVPLALTGGVLALFLRGLNFSMSAAIGFIALSGVAVLNGLVIVTFIENLRATGMSVDEAVHEGAMERLRPVLMTALVAALGFVPMAIATGMGSEVQRPLATVVIGGIVSSTALTMVVLPVLYRLTHRDHLRTTDRHEKDAR